MPPTINKAKSRRRKKTDKPHLEIIAGDTGPSLASGFLSVSSTGTSPVTPTSGSTRYPNKNEITITRHENISFWRQCKKYAIEHTWAIPLFLFLTILLLYGINPSKSSIFQRFIFLSYKQQDHEPVPYENPQYGKGLWDIAFVSFYAIFLTFTREFVMQELLRPLARFYGIKSRRKQLRYMEQMYTAIYFSIMSPVGFYVMRQTPVWYFNTRGMYESYPHKTHEANFKFYYLFQAAYWTQQAFVMLMGLEKPRKDYNELITHHIVTLSLIALSYRFHFAYMGIAVYLSHDISDFALALSKSLHYIDSSWVGASFGSSIIVWIYTRNYQNIRIILSLFTEYRTVGPYGMVWETEQYKGRLSNVITFGLLATLQTLNLIWLFFLLRSAYRFVVYKIAKDDRSDDEESELEEPGKGMEKETETTLRRS